MLILFGIPFLDAPQEAEAECASLLTRSLVDGVVTDDSDVFLFGASRVYRHMFDGNKYLECYLATDLERELDLDRDQLVRLAYLLGGDYDDGLPGVGPVLARELLQEFKGPDGLTQFKQWWKKVEEGKDSNLETDTPWKRKFVRFFFPLPRPPSRVNVGKFALRRTDVPHSRSFSVFVCVCVCAFDRPRKKVTRHS